MDCFQEEKNTETKLYEEWLKALNMPCLQKREWIGAIYQYLNSYHD